MLEKSYSPWPARDEGTKAGSGWMEQHDFGAGQHGEIHTNNTSRRK